VGPRHIFINKFSEESSGYRRASALPLAKIVQIVTIMIGYLTSIMFEQRHSPDAIARFNARFIECLPHFFVVREKSGQTISQRNFDGSGQSGQIDDTFGFEA
jgi:hypothetical protein